MNRANFFKNIFLCKHIPQLVFSAGLFTYLCAECFSPDSLSTESSLSAQLSRVTKEAVAVDEQCLVSIVKNFNSEKKEDAKNFLLILDRCSTDDKFNWNSLLFCAFRNKSIYKNKTLWSAVRKCWSKWNRSPHETFMALVNDGFPAQADTLYTIFDKDTVLDKYALGRWAKVKNVTGDYSNIPDLFCRSLQQSESGYIEIVLMQFNGVLSENSPEIVDTLIGLFADRCFPGLKLSDDNKSIVFTWIIEAWGDLNNFRKQVQFIRKSVPEKDAGAVLYQVAKKYSMRKKSIAAASVASAAYHYAIDEKIRLQAANIAFQSWVALNRGDSSAVWIERAGLDNNNIKIEAIVLYQNQGNFGKAMQLINDLPRSLARDTLTIRQSLCKKESDSTVFAQLAKSTFLNDEPILHELWKLRLLLYHKNLSAFQILVDSLRSTPEWSVFPEMLKYRYWLQKFAGKEDMLTAWAMIEYYNFIGKPQRSSELLCSGNIADSLRSLLVREVAQELLKRSAQETMNFLNQCNDTISDPGVMYFRAEASHLTGNSKDAQALLQSIILNYPDDVYCGKARVLLMKVTKGR
ncbi:MAG: hypothetical protein JW915_03520 [Chitinispirillaceae bacterium]|nr:hypothetical protein [Chitinispirillaceae bacterium]